VKVCILAKNKKNRAKRGRPYAWRKGKTERWSDAAGSGCTRDARRRKRREGTGKKRMQDDRPFETFENLRLRNTTPSLIGKGTQEARAT